MRLTDYTALSFDCYGTLIDWETGLITVLRDWAERRAVDLEDEGLLAAYADHEAATEQRQPRDRYPQILADSLRALGAALGAEVTVEDAEILAHSVPDWPAFDDSAAALARLSTRYQLIVLSNVDRASFAASSPRLGARFASVITAEDVGAYKPAPANFAALQAEAARLGIEPGRLLHVAQSLFHDHVPAQRIGLPTAWINRRADRPGSGATPEVRDTVTPQWTFGSLAEFADTAGV